MSLPGLIQNGVTYTKTGRIQSRQRKPTRNSRALPCRVCQRILPLSFYPCRHLDNSLNNPSVSVCQTCEKLPFPKEKLNKSDVMLEKTPPSPVINYSETPKKQVVENEPAANMESTLSRQQLTSSVEKPFPCPHCEKSFGSKQKLRLHSTVHTGEKRYVCTECGKRFRLSQSLNIHRRVHTGETPYQCAVCGKRFKSLPSIYSHRKTHTR